MLCNSLTENIHIEVINLVLKVIVSWKDFFQRCFFKTTF